MAHPSMIAYHLELQRLACLQTGSMYSQAQGVNPPRPMMMTSASRLPAFPMPLTEPAKFARRSNVSPLAATSISPLANVLLQAQNQFILSANIMKQEQDRKAEVTESSVGDIEPHSKIMSNAKFGEKSVAPPSISPLAMYPYNTLETQMGLFMQSSMMITPSPTPSPKLHASNLPLDLSQKQQLYGRQDVAEEDDDIEIDVVTVDPVEEDDIQESKPDQKGQPAPERQPDKAIPLIKQEVGQPTYDSAPALAKGTQDPEESKPAQVFLMTKPKRSTVFSCTKKGCNRSYDKAPALAQHKKTHKAGFKCETCGKTFTRQWLLTCHIRTHTGEKPFPCSICGKSFADRSNKSAHEETHSSVKAYSCPICGKTFVAKTYLKKHRINTKCGKRRK